jgi:hypothetical protein
MKWKAVLILVSIVMSIIIPPVLPVMTADGGNTLIGTLDVCHSSTPALSSNGTVPCINECACNHLPLAQIIAVGMMNTPLKATLLVFQVERPPKA